MPELSRLTWPDPSKREPSQCVLAVRVVAMPCSFAVLSTRPDGSPASGEELLQPYPLFPTGHGSSPVGTAPRRAGQDQRAASDAS